MPRTSSKEGQTSSSSGLAFLALDDGVALADALRFRFALDEEILVGSDFSGVGPTLI
jgi:hypothetical protein